MSVENLAKHISIVTLVIMVVLAFTGVFLYEQISGKGSGPIENWIGRQIQAVVNDHLHPQLTFDTIDYQAPKTVVLTNPRLLAQDPTGRGTAVKVFGAKSLTIELAKIPRRGQPIKIQHIEAVKPELRLIGYRKNDGSQGLAGLSNLLRQQPKQATQPKQKSTKLSDVLRIRSMRIRDGQLVYDPASKDQPTMTLDGITTQLNLKKADTGWYSFDLDLGRAPLLRLTTKGRFNVDQMAAKVEQLALKADLGRQKLNALPPRLQSFLKKHEVLGQCELTAKGKITFADWHNAQFNADLSVKQAKFAQGDYQLPIRKLKMTVSTADGRAKIKQLQVHTLGGGLKAQGKMSLTAPYQTLAQVDVQQLDLHKAMRLGEDQGKDQADDEGNPGDEHARVNKNKMTTSTLAGRVSGYVKANTTLAKAMHTTHGQGDLKLRHGKLTAIPVVSKILGLLRQAADIVSGDQASDESNNDKAHVVFTLEGDHAKFSKITAQTTLLALNAHGKIGFNQKLDLIAHAGPLQKLQQLMGEAGEVVGAVTDRLAQYEITGTLNKPKIGVGLGTGG